MRQNSRLYSVLASAFVVFSGFSLAEIERHEAILPELPKSHLVLANTVPSNGDINTSGLAFVPTLFPLGGATSGGDILVSNFNSSMNQQGTGVTVVSVSPGGNTKVFFQGTSGLGLTTALGVLERGVVLVGNVPTTDGSLITTNGDAINGDPNHPSEMIEFTPSGHFVAVLSVDPGGQGGAFGLALTGTDDSLKIAAVDDVNNTLKLWTVR